ncbi:MAG: tryptophan synthase subunit alpha [Acidimicrobiia bacterium]
MSTSTSRSDVLEERLREAGGTVVPYLTGGFPTISEFGEALRALARDTIAVEVGIPFSDPMADGATIQESSRVALAQGATLETILGEIERSAPLSAELVVMSYLNPLLAYGQERLIPRLASVGVAALVVPDLPLEEAGELASALGEQGIGLVQLVSPVTDRERLETLGAASRGFTYAVTMTGTTGGTVGTGGDVVSYLETVRSSSRAPVLAGFGVRTRRHVETLAPHCDGVIVGSALVEVLSNGDDPVRFLKELSS